MPRQTLWEKCQQGSEPQRVFDARWDEEQRREELQAQARPYIVGTERAARDMAKQFGRGRFGGGYRRPKFYDDGD